MKWGTQKWPVPISMPSSAKNKEIWDTQNPQPEQPFGNKGKLGEGKGERGRGEPLAYLRQKKAAALTLVLSPGKGEPGTNLRGSSR